MRVYATPDDLDESVPAEDAEALLRTASRMADEALLGRVYDTDADGYPTDPDERQALTDAVVAITAELAAIGVNTAGGTQTWASVGIGGVSLSGGGTAEGTVTVMGLPVPPAAVVALRSVGRFGWSVGPAGQASLMDRVAR